MMYKIRITARAKRELKNLSRKNFIAIGLVLEDLKENPYIGKKLERELNKRFVYRVGVYRIIYKIFEKGLIVEIISAGHRSTIYN